MAVNELNDVAALIAQGDALAKSGDLRGASAFYRSALNVASAIVPLPQNLIPELQRIQSAAQAQARAYQNHLGSKLSEAGYCRETSSERFSRSLDLMSGRKRLYFQEPKFYLFPGLPQIEFKPRDELPWLRDLENAARSIRAELDALISQQNLFRPYVEARENRPNGDQAGMLKNPDWSALFLYKDGVQQSDMVERCPRTMEALADLPLCRIPGRTPSILFSKLAAGARIPPHHGMVNIRLICHVPLITPPGCYLRVGKDVREWQDGQAWAFDDTIEHEARNDSDSDRTILIFDVWKDEITREERELISAMFVAIDQFGAGGSDWGV